MAKTKFDIKTEATRPLYAGVGVTDLAVEFVRGYVTDVQTRVADVQKNVTELRPPAAGPARAGRHRRERPRAGALQGRQGPP